MSALHGRRVGLVAGEPVLAHPELFHAARHHALALAAGDVLVGVARVLARLALRQVVCVFGVCSKRGMSVRYVFEARRRRFLVKVAMIGRLGPGRGVIRTVVAGDKLLDLLLLGLGLSINHYGGIVFAEV